MTNTEQAVRDLINAFDAIPQDDRARALSRFPIADLEEALSIAYTRYAAALGPAVRRVCEPCRGAGALTTLAVRRPLAVMVFGTDQLANYSIQHDRHPDDSIEDFMRKIPAATHKDLQRWLTATKED